MKLIIRLLILLKYINILKFQYIENINNKNFILTMLLN